MIRDSVAMRFEDSEEQALLRETARGFLADRYPVARLFEIERGEAPISKSDLAEVGDLGWLGLTVREEAGGAGLSLLEAAVILEEVGYAGAPIPIAPANVSADVLGTAERFCAVGEEARGAAAPLTIAAGLLSGTVGLVSAAELASGVLVPVRQDEATLMAVVALEHAEKLAAPAMDRRDCFDLRFSVAATAEARIVARGAAATAMAERTSVLLTAFRLLEAVGMMKRVVELTAAYITERTAFGKPIATFQAARHRAANLGMDAEMTRWAAYHGLYRLQTSGTDTGGIWRAKHWALRATERMLINAHMLHGGVGISMEHPLHLFSQGLMANAVRGGTMDEMVRRSTAWLDGDATARSSNNRGR